MEKRDFNTKFKKEMPNVKVKSVFDSRHFQHSNRNQAAPLIEKTSFSKTGLKKAFLMSEILGKPAALRGRIFAKSSNCR